MDIQEFIQSLKEKGIELSDTQIEQFALYYKLLIEWNNKMNLTAITEEKEVYLKHFYDSLVPLWLVPQDTYVVKLCDVGSGAGFPSVPLKIIHPELELTIVDSLNKRLTFLEELTKSLGLEKVELVHGRAEDVGQDPKYRAQFDLVTARAVASLNVLCEYCLPLVKKGGHFIALKGQQAEEEIEEAQTAINVLGAKFISSPTVTLPTEDSTRSIVVIKKTLDTPKKYPRRAGIPSKKPIK